MTSIYQQLEKEVKRKWKYFRSIPHFRGRILECYDVLNKYCVIIQPDMSIEEKITFITDGKTKKILYMSPNTCEILGKRYSRKFLDSLLKKLRKEHLEVKIENE